MKLNEIILNEVDKEDRDVDRAPAVGDTGKLITTAQAAKILDVTMSRVRQLIMDGDLKARDPKKGRRDNFLKSSDVYAIKNKMEKEEKEEQENVADRERAKEKAKENRAKSKKSEK